MKNKFKTGKLKRVLFSLCLLFVFLTYNFVFSASIIDDIKNVFGISNEVSSPSETTTESYELIDSELENSLTGDEKGVVELIREVVERVKQVDIDSICKYFGTSDNSKDLDTVIKFFDEYPEALNSVRIILSRFNVKINDIRIENGRVYVNIIIEHPSIKDLALTIMPEVIFNNAGALISSNLTYENINSILNSIRKAIEKNNMGLDKLNLNLEFKEVDGEWFIANDEEVAKVVEDHFNNIESVFIGNIR